MREDAASTRVARVFLSRRAFFFADWFAHPPGKFPANFDANFRRPFQPCFQKYLQNSAMGLP
jgi:hypothetical protein